MADMSMQRRGHFDAFQDGDRFIVRADLPGLEPEDIDVEISDESLTILGEHADAREEAASFHRTIPLPKSVIADSAKANFKDGVLEVTMEAPAAEVRRGRKIKIGEPTPS